MKKLLLLLLVASQCVNAQDDLLAELSMEAEEEVFQIPAFKAMKIGNLQSTKVAAKGDLFMYVSHRFGSLEDGINTFFGLDNANTKIQMLYGVVDGFQISLSRESLRKTFAGAAKLKAISQTNKMPIALSFYSTINYHSGVSLTRYPHLVEQDLLSYATQMLIARRFSNRLSLELAPTFVRQNLVFDADQNHNQFAIGAGGRFKITKRSSVNIDYSYLLNRSENNSYNNPLTIGMDIETGGHIFQLMFSNAQSTNEPGFISNAEGNWSDGNIYFGFNIVRVF